MVRTDRFDFQRVEYDFLRSAKIILLALKGILLSKVSFGDEQRGVGERLDNALLGSRFSGQG